MEVPVPEGCALKSITFTVETDEAFEALRKLSGAVKFDGSVVHKESATDRLYQQDTLMIPGDSLGVEVLYCHFNGPRHYITLTPDA